MHQEARFIHIQIHCTLLAAWVQVLCYSLLLIIFSSPGIIQNLEEESNTNKYMVADVHPKEIASLKKTIQQLQKIVSEPAMGQSDLDQIVMRVNFYLVLF